jgi:hypothetical protein
LFEWVLPERALEAWEAAMNENVRAEYASMLAKTPPAVIRNAKENEHYTSLLDKLDHKPGTLTAEQRLAELLTLLIEDFEAKHYALKPATGTDALTELMEANG